MKYDSDDSDYGPIGIFEITVKHKSPNESRAATYTCKGDGLFRHGHAYDPDVKQYLPLADPTRTKAGTVRKNKSRIKKMPLEWWKAQCGFRGLSVGGKIAELQARLRPAPNAPMIQELKDLTKRTEKEFRIKDAAARVEQRAQQKAKENVAEAETRQFLATMFPRRGKASDRDEDKVIMVELGSHYELEQVATSFGLITSYFRSQLVNFLRPSEDWFVVGWNASAVDKKTMELKRTDRQKVMEAEREGQRAEKRKQEAAEELARGKRQKVLDEASKSKNWNVMGSWEISCPYIEKNWEKTQNFTLDIYSEKTANGPQMFAKFHFGVIEGVFRFERQKNVVEKQIVKVDGRKNNSKVAKGHGAHVNKDYSEDSEDEDLGNEYLEDEEFEDDSDRRSPTPEYFFLDSTAREPSPKYPSWTYRWRGQETGEGEIQLGSDKDTYEITFGEPMGTKLTGTIGGDLFKKCNFTGVKMGTGHSSGIDISNEWAELGGAAYERARVERWH